MSIVEVQVPDGRVVKVQAPDGATQEDIFEFASQSLPEAPKSRSVQEIKKEVTAERHEREKLEDADKGILDRLSESNYSPAGALLSLGGEGDKATILEQAGRGMQDVYQGAEQLALHAAKYMHENPKLAILAQTSPIGPILASSGFLYKDGEAEKYDVELANELSHFEELNPGFSWGRLAGSIATPLSLIPGAGAGGTIGSRMLSSSLMGLAGGLTQPVKDPENFAKSKAIQAGVGMTIGAAFPVATKIVSKIGGWADELIKPFYREGIFRDVGKFLRKEVPQNREKIIDTLQRSIANKDGRTVGRIIADATKDTKDDFGGILVRLERDLKKESDALKEIYRLQDANHTATIDKIAGSEADLANALAQRAKNGAENYAKAWKVPVQPDEELKKITNNNFFRKALQTADDVTSVNKSASLTQRLHYVKEGLDKMLNSTGDDPLTKEGLRAVAKVKNEMLDWLKTKNPLYEKAREQYARESGPINRMQIGVTLKNAFTNAVGDKKPGILANAIRNAHQTIKKSTGQNRFDKLDDILLPSEVKSLKGIVSDLQTSARQREMSGSGPYGSKAVLSKLHDEITVNLPSFFIRPIVVAKHQLMNLAENKSAQYKEVLNDLLVDPVEFLRAYKQPSTSKLSQHAQDILQRLSVIGASKEAGEEQ